MAIAELESAIRTGLGDDMSEAEPKPVPAKVEVQVESSKVDETSEPGVIKGVGAAPGIAVGPIFHFKQTTFDLEKLEKLPIENQIGLDEALTRAEAELADLYQQMTEKKLGAEAAIFEAHNH